MIEAIQKANLTNSTEVLEIVKLAYKNKERVEICYLNFHHLINPKWTATLKPIFLDKKYILADGVGITFSKKILTENHISKIIEPVTDIYYSILKYAEINKFKVFFLGGNEELIHKLSFTIHNKFPELINLNFEHGYLKYDDRDVLDKINNSSSDILFIGMGVPVQEEWLSQNESKLNVPIIITCGGFLKFLSDETPRAPFWIRNIGFEWLHRMIFDFRHLWKRYFFGIPKFLFLIAKCYFRKKN